MSDAFYVYNAQGELIDTVFYNRCITAPEVKSELIERDNFDIDIRVIMEGHSFCEESDDEDFILNNEPAYIDAIECGILDENTLEFFWG